MERDFLQTLAEFERRLVEGWRIPLTDWVVVDEMALYELLNRLRNELPEEIAEARDVLQRKDEIMEEARQESQEIVDNAQSYLEKKAEETDIHQLAQEKSRQRLAKAEKTAAEIKTRALEYADEVLAEVQVRLEEELQMIREGREQLQVEPRSSKSQTETEQAGLEETERSVPKDDDFV